MKTNEARPIFRIIAFLIAIPMWFVFFSAGYSILNTGTDEYTTWKLVLGMLIGAASFSYIAFVGYLPRFLLHLWTRGPVADEKDLK